MWIHLKQQLTGCLNIAKSPAVPAIITVQRRLLGGSRVFNVDEFQINLYGERGKAGVHSVLIKVSARARAPAKIC